MGHETTFGCSSYEFPTESSGIDTLMRITKYAMIFTGFSYASWHLLRSYVLPRFFHIPEPVDERIGMIEAKVGFYVYCFILHESGLVNFRI